jgi:hypothetical protein
MSSSRARVAYLVLQAALMTEKGEKGKGRVRGESTSDRAGAGRLNRRLKNKAEHELKKERKSLALRERDLG